MKKSRVLALLVAVAVIVAMMPVVAFADEALTTTATEAIKSDDIIILTTNDVHCKIDQNIGYAGLAAYKKDMQSKYNYVTLVDAGDAVQGDTIGTLSKGEYLIDIMNQVGYDIAVPGNHEFDYGMDQFRNVLVKNSKATYLSCNFVDNAGKNVFDSYKIISYGDVKVAYVGISTPETFTKSTPTYFQDANGKYIYGFCQGDNGKELYAAVQKAVDAAKKAGANYVVAVGHLGTDEASTPWTSTEVIQNTSGIDVLVDGHSHSVIAGNTVKAKDGKAVKVISTGTELTNIGQITIKADGTIATTLVSGDLAKDAETAAYVNKIKEKYAALEATEVAKSSVLLRIYDDEGNRLIRSQETNLGDLCADAYRNVLGADIAFVNGGGIRANIESGSITYGQVIAVHPYGNMACVIEATGQEILDALELGSRNVGKGESGGFLQVSGLTYDINTFIDSNVVLNDKNEFVKVDGDYRVTNVMVGGKPLDLAKTYTLASHNYMLKSGGDGYTMFKDNKILQDEVMIDNQVLINYIQNNLKGVVGSEYAAPQGRINIINTQAFAVLSQKLQIAEYDCKLKATSGKTYIKLAWNACKADGVKYQIYKSTKSTSGFKKAYTTSKTTFKTTKITKGKKYYFKVRATKTIDGAVYYGHWSNKVSKKTA